MWITTQYQGNQEQVERMLDLLLKISPDIFLFEGSLNSEGSIFLDLRKLAHYWDLKTLEEEENPLKKLLLSFSQKEGLRFVVAPTAAWAYFYFQITETGDNAPLCEDSYLGIYRSEKCQEDLPQFSLPLMSHFLKDHLTRSSSNKSEWIFFTESLEVLGLKSLPQFTRFCQNPMQLEQMTERMGLCPKILYKRLSEKEDFPLKLYQPQTALKEQFYPDLESQIGSPAKLDILDRLQDVLKEWEERLRLRKSLIKGFEVLLLCNKGRTQRSLCLSLPRPTRDSQTLFRLLHEKWLACTDKFSEYDMDLRAFVFEEVKISSLGLQFESDRQLHLFDPKREDRQEEWSLLVGNLESISHDVRVGHYAAHASYWPEFSVEWQNWSDSKPIALVEEHPPRPLLIYSPPQNFSEENIMSEDDFVKLLVKKQSLSSLERISDPWRGDERSYARVEKQWLYWDHKKQKCFVHGVFPDASA